jgi:cobalt/nickel transport system ATP-binding protein
VAGMSGPIVEVRDLTYRYPDGTPALDAIALSVAAGESVAIVGPNGAGKTTLFLCLAGVLGRTPGQVRVAGLDPAMASDRTQLPARLGIIFQNSDDQLFSATVAEDIAFGPLNLGLPAEEVRRRVDEALAAVGRPDLRDRPPHHLSGGEKRRVALAGVLAMRPEVLLLDEPSMFLDPRGRRGMIRWLIDYPGTKILATHDLDLVLDVCPRVLVFDAGKKVAEGSAGTVLGDAGLMEAHGLEVPHRLRVVVSG